MDNPDNPAKATYRLFWTNGAGRITSVAQMIEAANDREAIEQAQVRSEGFNAEVWSGSRLVAMLNRTDRIEE